MPIVNVVRSEVNNHSVLGGSMPVISSQVKSTETFTDVATLKETADQATSSITEFWVITATGVSVYVKFGENPLASFENDWLILDGQTREFSCVRGDKIAILDVASVIVIILYGLDFSTEENSMTFVTPGFL